MPRWAALARTIIGSPSRVRSATLRRRRTSAARRIRSSSPSGRTMWRRSAIASSRTWCSNISGVTTEVRATSRPLISSSPSTCSAKSFNAVAILRGESLSRRPRRLVSAVEVAWVPRSVAIIGSATSSPSSSRPTCSGSSSPPLRTTPEICGKLADWCAVSTPRTTSGRSPGVTTSAPSKSRSSTLGRVIAATTRPGTSRASWLSSPRTRRPSQAAIRSPTEGALSRGCSGSAKAGTPSRRSAAAVRSVAAGSTRLAMTAKSFAWLAASSASAIAAAVHSWSTPRPLPLRTSRTGAPRLAATRALKANSAGAPTSV